MDRFAQLQQGLSVELETLDVRGVDRDVVTMSLDDFEKLVKDYIAMSNALCVFNPALEGAADGEPHTMDYYLGQTS